MTEVNTNMQMSCANPISRDTGEFTVTIANGGTATAAIPIGGAAWGTVQMPAAITGTNLTTKYSLDGTNFTSVPAEGSEANPDTVAANGTYRLPAMTFAAKYFQLVMDTQGAARTLRVFLRG